MGVRWKHVEQLPVGNGIVIAHDPAAWSKRVPLIWRFQHSWYLLSIAKSRSADQCTLYFESAAVKMKLRRRLSKEFIAVRIGNKDVRFLAIGRDGHEVPIISLTSKPESLHEICFQNYFSALLYLSESITFV